MGQYAAWLLDRFRGRYLGLVELTLLAVALVTVIPFTAVHAMYVDLDRGELLSLLLIAVAISVIGVHFGIVLMRPRMRPVRAWLEGDRTDPHGAWSAALSFPRAALLRSLAVGAVLSPPGVAAWLVAIGDLDLAEQAVFWPASLLMALAQTQNLAIALRTMMRPIIEETAPMLPFNAVSSEPSQSAVRLLGFSLLGAAYLTGLTVPLMVIGTSPTTEEFATAVVGALAVAFLVGGLTVLLVTTPLVGPVKDLLSATNRVRRGDLSTPVVVSSSDEFGELADAFNEMQVGLRERQALSDAFGSYVDPALAQRLIDSGSSIFEGEDLVVTVLFADVRDFTALSERIESADAVALLNRLFDLIVPVIHERGGHANHYLGDGLLAVFGAPHPLECHADAAVAAAVEIQQKLRAEFGTTLRLGIGVNTGPVIAGTVGGGGRHEFTVIGDTVNVAARVEQLTKDTGDSILITEATRCALSTPKQRSIKRGAFDLKGKAAKITVHAVNPFPRSTR